MTCIQRDSLRSGGNRNASAVSAWSGLILVALALATPGCKKKEAPPAGPPDATYTVRGVIKAFPEWVEPGNGKTITVLHQAIADFKDRDGEVVGMMAMPMPFPIAAGVDVSNIRSGDKIEFSFDVRWGEENPTLITKMRKLPDDTVIVFSAPEPADEAPDETGAPSDAGAISAPAVDPHESHQH